MKLTSFIKPDAPIAFFIPSMRCGGAEKVVVTLANTLSGIADRPIHVVVVNAEGPFISDLGSNVLLVNLAKSRTLYSIFALAAYIRTEKPAVLMSSMSHANIIAVFAHRLAGRPGKLVLRETNVILCPTGGLFNRFRQWCYVALARSIYRWADRIIANSDQTLDSMRDAGFRIVNQTVVISNPIDSNNTRLTQNSDFDVPAHFICAVGRLEKQKGFDVLLESFSRLADTSLFLVIIGEGSLRRALTQQAIGLGICDRVLMPGFLPNPGAIINKSSVFVLSSHYEGFGNVLVEALAAGVPIVSTDCRGAPRFILENGRHGHLVPVNDPQALSKGIIQALSNPAGSREDRIRRARYFSVERISLEYWSRALSPESFNV